MENDYKQIIKRKNKIVTITLLICIVLRGLVEAFFIGLNDSIPLMLAGLVLAGIILLLTRFFDSVVVMYLFTFILAVIVFMVMNGFPNMINFMQCFLAIFFIVLYEDIRPIVIESICMALEMIYFYYRYPKVFSINNFGVDSLWVAVVYIFSGMLIFVSLSRLTREQINNLHEIGEKSHRENRKSSRLLDEIGKSATALGASSGKINTSVINTSEAVSQINEAAESVTKMVEDDAESTKSIQSMVKDSVVMIDDMNSISHEMYDSSIDTDQKVREGASGISSLSGEMSTLSEKMDSVEKSVSDLGDKVSSIENILATLDDISEQTSLLSLNASIEAARAGEQGRGFAVVAEQIRNLADNSSQFTKQIHNIIGEIETSTTEVRTEIGSGQESVRICTEHADKVNKHFEKISKNTGIVLDQAKTIAENAKELNGQMQATMNNVNAISETTVSTSAAMEEILASISNLNDDMNNVVEGYKGIEGITKDLIDASVKQD